MGSTARPFFNVSISDLEEEIPYREDDVEFLCALLHELGYRSTDRAVRLKVKAEQALARAQKSPPRGAPPPRPEPPPRTPPREPSRPEPREANSPEAILDVWTAFEVLSPPLSFRHPKDLAGGDLKAIALFDRDPLPWEGEGERARPNTRVYYQIVLGSVDLEKAFAGLLAQYSDSRVERPTARGETILAGVLVDREGKLIEAPAASISSFGWGVPIALRGNLAALAGWRLAEAEMVDKLDEILRQTDDEGQDLPLSRQVIQDAYEWLVSTLGLPQDLVSPPRFAVRAYQYYKSPDPPEPLLLNSFFLGDLATARASFVQGRLTPNLRRYLGVETPAERHDLLEDVSALESAVAPDAIPPARWPGEGRHSLVLLQQAAVNLAVRELRETGILAVNGPPGTGKTTLLRDLVAANITARAEAMADFDDPADAFLHSGEKLKAGNAWLHLYQLDPKLRGFEMIVASSNNKAVENVSAELPGLKSIAKDAADLRYFKTLSDALRQNESWGLIAAVLGNASNRSRFKQTFWWDEDVGLSSYLAAAAGTPQLIEIIDHESGTRTTRPPRIVSQENPPGSADEALRRWKQARTAFRTALAKSRKILEELARIRGMAASLPALAREEADAVAAEATVREREERCHTRVAAGRGRLVEAQTASADKERKLADHEAVRPGFWARLFRAQPARTWRAVKSQLADKHREARDALSAAETSLRSDEQVLSQTQAERQAAEGHRLLVATRHARARREVATAREQIGQGFIDQGFFAREHADRHKTTPWLDTARQRARDNVFVAAMALHKAFVDASAKRLRHNLGVLMSLFGGRSLPTAEKRALIPDLWASFFLVVPLISTTFASVERMLGDLPAESLGWLFVDEAGQALPQGAVGALMRTRRTVIVGDPLQIEPIVPLPDTLTHALCRHFKVDPDLYNAPNASVQTLADRATPYMAEFQGRHGSRAVGVPLLVHRRCADPMFSTSNAVAYERLMVHAKAPGTSVIGEILGPSGWFDIQGSAAEKWCPEEGEEVLSLLRCLAAKKSIFDGPPDLYIVTPFVVVAENLRRLVRESSVLAGWTDDPHRWTQERIGTVHTVQGREAEAVIFVLGAPAPQQAGARNWAGGRPNLLNVAVTRAKERLYVVGNRDLWQKAGLFRELDARLPPAAAPRPDEPEEEESAEPHIEGQTVYAAESATSCWRCGQETLVVALAYEVLGESGESVLTLLSQVEDLDADALRVLGNLYPRVRKRASKSSGRTYFMNHCVCGAPLGDFYLHQEPGSSFAPLSPEEANRIRLRRLPLPGPLILRGGYTSSTDELISRHARREGA